MALLSTELAASRIKRYYVPDELENRAVTKTYVWIDNMGRSCFTPINPSIDKSSSISGQWSP
jgi:hypothetical protein